MHRATWAAFSQELQKLGEVTTQLLPHQQRVVDRLRSSDQPGLVAVHGLGSGKTLTSIAAQEALGLPSTVIAPAALQKNYRKEVAKHTKGKTQKRRLATMQLVARRGEPPQNPMLIVDEAHRARDTSTKTFKALEASEAEKRLLLTGSPFYNHPADIAPLINLAANQDVLPRDKDVFSKRYITEKKVGPGLFNRLVTGAESGVVPTLNRGREKELRKVFGKWVDHYPGSSENFPTVERQDVKVPMTEEQLKIYESAMGQAPAWVAAKVKKGLPPSKAESKQLNAFLSAARQISNSTAGFQTEGKTHDPKIQAAFDHLKATLDSDPTAKGVVYSNFLESGINPYKQRLQAANIPFGEFTGELRDHDRQKLVKDYNAGKLRALLLSSAGGEGLDLKGTRLLQVLDPHWNDEKLRQVEGRAARYMSHADLPEDKRKVLMQHYLATRPRHGILEKLKLRDPGGSSDEYLSQLAEDKSNLIQQFKDLLPQHR